MTDPTGQTVYYSYDDARRVTQVITTSPTSGATYWNAYTYENDRIRTVSHNANATENVVYTFDYDALGRKTTVKVGTVTLSTNVYMADRSGLLEEVQYGNGGKVKYQYDGFDRLTGVMYDSETSPRYTYEYGANGEAAQVTDNHLSRISRTEYDQADRPCETELRDSLTGSRLYQTCLKYNKLNQLEQFAERVGSDLHTTKYAYDRDNRVTEIQYDGTIHKVGYSYDALGRLSTRTVESGDSAGTLTSTYTYEDGGYGTNSTTPLVKKITQNGISFEYTYDSRGNITSEKRGSLTTSYEYDLLGRLTRINDPHDTTAESYGTTWLFHYDLGGNIVRKTPYAYTTSGSVGFPYGSTDYEYGDSNWRDKLTGYNGVSITYDAIGNPLNDGTWTYTWAAGRQLQGMVSSSKSVSFQYDHNGLRTRKTVTEGNATTVTDYILHGKLVMHMTVSKTVGGVTTQDTLHFFYDAQSRPAKVSYNGTMYTYLHNLQGDIVGILDSSDALVVEYKYDAWGRALSTVSSLTTELAEENPFRYRGYIYDEETGLYYLRSRYYNPTWYRFVNADDIFTDNIYTYCSDEPVNNIDDNGAYWIGVFHQEVQDDIIKKFTSIDEIVIRNAPCITKDGGKGFIDLLRINTLECWEVKPKLEYWVEIGIDQLRNYVNGNKLRSSKRLIRSIKGADLNGKLEIGKYHKFLCGTISYDGPDVSCDINYEYCDGGLILYELKNVRRKNSVMLPAAKDESKGRVKSRVSFPAIAGASASVGTALGTALTVAVGGGRSMHLNMYYAFR